MPSLGIDLCPPELFIPPGQTPGDEITTLPAVIKLSPEQVVENSAFVDADDLQWLALRPGSYIFRMTAFWTTERKRTGLKVAMDFTGLHLLIRYFVRDATGTATANVDSLVRRGLKAPAVNWLTIDGVVVTERVGDLKLQIASENDHPVSLHPGSFGTLMRSGA